MTSPLMVAKVNSIRKCREERASLLFSFNLFLTMAAFYLVKALRGATVIQELGADSLPQIWIVSVALLGVFVAVYNRVEQKIRKRDLIFFLGIGFAISLVGLHSLPDRFGHAKAVLLYLWADIFSVLMVEQLWTMSNDFFRIDVAKKYYGRIAIGGALGGITGSAIAGFSGLGKETWMVAVTAGIILMISALAVVSSKAKPATKRSERKEAEPQEVTSSLTKLILENRYLALLAFSLIFTQVISSLIDFQFNKIVETSVAGFSMRQMFFGKFYFWMNIGNFLFASLLTAPLKNFLGEIEGLIVMPLGTFCAIAAFIMFPIPALGFALKFFDKSLNYSINRISRETLYFKSNEGEKARAKAAIDIFGARMGRILSAFLVIGISRLAPEHLPTVGLLLSAALVFVFAFSAFKQKAREATEKWEAERMQISLPSLLPVPNQSSKFHPDQNHYQ